MKVDNEVITNLVYLKWLTDPYSNPQASMHKYWQVAVLWIFIWPTPTVDLCNMAEKKELGDKIFSIILGFIKSKPSKMDTL